MHRGKQLRIGTKDIATRQRKKRHGKKCLHDFSVMCEDWLQHKRLGVEVDPIMCSCLQLSLDLNMGGS